MAASPYLFPAEPGPRTGSSTAERNPLAAGVVAVPPSGREDESRKEILLEKKGGGTPSTRGVVSKSNWLGRNTTKTFSPDRRPTRPPGACSYTEIPPEKSLAEFPTAPSA